MVPIRARRDPTMSVSDRRLPTSFGHAIGSENAQVNVVVLPLAGRGQWVVVRDGRPVTLAAIANPATRTQAPSSMRNPH